MTQIDLNNGRLVREIDVAVGRPVEFVIFRICRVGLYPPLVVQRPLRAHVELSFLNMSSVISMKCHFLIPSLLNAVVSQYCHPERSEAIGAGPGLTADVYLRVAISSDNSRVFFNDDGWPFYLDTATDKFYGATVDPACCYGDYELSLAAGQSTVEATGYLYDFSLDAQSAYAMNVREALNIGYIYGAKLSANGSVLFQPTTIGIDVMEGRLGHLLQRVALPVQLLPNDDALVSDGKANVLVAITGRTVMGLRLSVLA